MNPTESALQVLINSLCDPEEAWLFEEHACTRYARHAISPRFRPTAVRVWICNGPMACDTYPVKMGLGFFQRWRLWKAVKVARARYMEKCLKEVYHADHSLPVQSKENHEQN